ncbi:MAG: porin [Thiohalophilus sp.]|uniref:porin n=1 Tax=Thiohalophilus sp. TaxID=3028392 RepID=UPI0028705FA3|nr:porin [Thiohalophilus sp.]MDR9437796.1 porin [Thiohalophilus sp.]
MKKKLIALAVTGALMTPMLAQAAPTVYGKVHLSYGSVEEESGGVTTTDNWQLSSHASRVGVKGDRDLGNGLSAIYKFEWQVDYEQGGDAGFDRRNMYAGLKGSWGQVRFGRHDTPLKMAQGDFDQFGDTSADLKNAGDQDGDNRLDNVLAYLGKSGNIKYAIALIPGEGDGTTAGDGPADSISASIAYEDGPLYVALAQDSYDDTNGQAENSLTRLVGTYKMGNMQLGLLWQSGVEGATTAGEDEDWLGVSFKTKISAKNSFKAQYIMVEDNETTAREGTLMAVGIDHKFDKKTSGYLMYSNLEEELGNTTDVDNTFMGAGLVLKF